MVEWRGSFSKIESFAVGDILLDRTSGIFMRGSLKMKKFVAGALRAKNLL